MLKSPCVLVQHASLSCKYFALRQVTNMTVAKMKHISFYINCFPLILFVNTASKKKKKMCTTASTCAFSFFLRCLRLQIICLYLVRLSI